MSSLYFGEYLASFTPLLFIYIYSLLFINVAFAINMRKRASCFYGEDVKAADTMRDDRPRKANACFCKTILGILRALRLREKCQNHD